MSASKPSPVKLANYIGGEWVESRSAESLTDFNPATGRPVATFGDTTAEETRQAVAAAGRAAAAWGATPPHDRARGLMKLRNLMVAERDRMAEVLTIEHGKTYRESQLEFDRAIENVEVSTGVATLGMGRHLAQAAEGISEYTLPRPLGVTAAICPFNFPVMIPFWFLPYALACGNCMVVKASEKVPMTMVETFKLIHRAGLPAGVANLVLGARAAAEELLENPTVKAVSFVGSTPVGKQVYRKASAAFKRVQVQAGAKNFGVVMPDATFEQVLPNLVASAMDCTGQRCLALAAVIAVGSAYETVRDGMVEIARARKLGFGLDEGVQMGPVIDADAKVRIETWVQRGIDEGAEAILDGRGATVAGYDDGHWVGPTLLDGCHRDMAVVHEEIFGPVVCLLRAGSLDEALEIIRANRYGNAASIFTSDGAAARKFTTEAPCGNLGVNIGVAAPMAFFHFGGARESFFGDLHAQGRNALAFFTNSAVCVERWF